MHRAYSSAVEHCLHTAGVAGSKPAAPTRGWRISAGPFSFLSGPHRRNAWSRPRLRRVVRTFTVRRHYPRIDLRGGSSRLTRSSPNRYVRCSTGYSSTGFSSARLRAPAPDRALSCFSSRARACGASKEHSSTEGALDRSQDTSPIARAPDVLVRPATGRTRGPSVNAVEPPQPRDRSRSRPSRATHFANEPGSATRCRSCA